MHTLLHKAPKLAVFTEREAKLFTERALQKQGEREVLEIISRLELDYDFFLMGLEDNIAILRHCKKCSLPCVLHTEIQDGKLKAEMRYKIC